MIKGKIVAIERSHGFGFIETESGERVFFHQRWLRKVKFKDLREGDEVAFLVNRGPRGPRAFNLNLVVDEDLLETANRGDELFKI